MVKFCGTCGNMMMPTKTTDGTVEFVCKKCETTEKADKDIILKQKMKNHDRQETVIIKDQQEDVGTEELFCPTCKKNQPVAQWQVQTRSADEAPTTFYKCTICNETWRDYGG